MTNPNKNSTPRSSSVTLRTLLPTDTEIATKAVALLNRTQGQGLFGPTYLSQRLGNPEACVVAAFESDNLVGLGSVELLHDFAYHEPFAPGLSRELAGKRVASFNTLSVLESHQGRGIGQRLGHKRLDWARQQKCTVVLGVSWVSGLAHTSNRTFEKLGFRPGKRLEDFYKESSLKAPFDCPGCHVLPCTCAAILYRLDL